MSNNCSPKVQVKLNDIYKGKPYTPQTGVLDFCFSAANGSAAQAKMIQKNGKNSVYAVTRRASVCTTVVDCSEIACTDAGTDVSLTSCDTFDTFSCKSSEWHNLPISGLRDLGSMEVSEVLGGQVYDQMQAIKSAVDLAVLTSINSAAGSISTAVATKQLKLIDDTTKAPVWAVDTNIKMDFADAGFNEMPILLGNRTVALYKDAVGRSGLNQYGQQLNAIDTLNAFYDININSTNTAPTTTGNDVLFAILPQVVNLLSWSENSGVFSSRNQFSAADINAMKMVNTDNTTFVHSTLIDPATGQLYDFDVVYDPKCKKFQWRIFTYYKVLVNPLVGCKDAAFNGIVKYDVCPLSDVYCSVI
jgi:hypothetical protein